MIQRIQTVFLLFSAILIGLFLWMPLINLEPGLFNHPAGLRGWEIVHRYNGWMYLINLILAGTAFGLTYINIFLPALFNKEHGYFHLILRLMVPIIGWYGIFKKVIDPQFHYADSSVRQLQMLLCWFCIVFLGCAVLFVYYEYRIYIYPGGFVLFTPWNALAGVAALFQLLAYFYIGKDENTIKSLDRLR